MNSGNNETPRGAANDWIVLGIAVGAAAGIAYAVYASCEETKWDRAKKTLKSGVGEAKESLSAAGSDLLKQFSSVPRKARTVRKEVAHAGSGLLDQLDTIGKAYRLLRLGARVWSASRKLTP